MASPPGRLPRAAGPGQDAANQPGTAPVWAGMSRRPPPIPLHGHRRGLPPALLDAGSASTDAAQRCIRSRHTMLMPLRNPGIPAAPDGI